MEYIARMLSRLNIRNFRSIGEAQLTFGPITVFFGPTSAGKSSVFYSLLTLRNFVLNPNQPADSFFNLGFQNLGGFEECVFNHAANRRLSVEAEFPGHVSTGWYGFHLGQNEAEIHSTVHNIDLRTSVPIPYAANRTWSQSFTEAGQEYSINWNGIASTVSPASPAPETLHRATEIAERLNAPVDSITRIDICPHRRGFFKPNYTLVSPGVTPTTEDEVASLIISDPRAPARISGDIGEIFGRDFRIQTPPGTATTFFQTTEMKGARVPGLLVNDGFGVNQVIYMLAKIHRPGVSTVLIEEPEVHLHPTAIRSFARALARIVKEEEKQVVFTTHSEQFLLSLLACVKDRDLQYSDLVCYHTKRDGKATRFEREFVSSDGQIEGGLSSFVEAELQDMKTFLGVP
jgi:predicted ATPase